MRWPVNLYATVVELPELPLEPGSRRDRSDPALIEHLRGLAGWIASQGPEGELSRGQAHAIEHSWRVHNQLVFELEPGGEAAIEDLARTINAVVFLPDSTLRDPRGSVIVGPDATADVPFLDAALARRAATRARLRDRGIEILERLPPQPCEAEVSLRSLDDVRARAAGLFTVAVTGESRAIGEAIEEPILDRFPDALLTGRDRMFLEASDVPTEVLPEFTWKYESLNALLWALKLVDQLAFPDAICDVPHVARLSLDALAGAADLRSPTEICDALDEHHALHWLAVDRDLAGAPSPVDRGVIHERRVALSWLVRLGELDWDEITTPT